jgi:hypothetical protein
VADRWIVSPSGMRSRLRASGGEVTRPRSDLAEPSRPQPPRSTRPR